MKKNLFAVFAIMLLYLNVNAQYCLDSQRFTQNPVFSDSQIAYDTAVVYGNALNFEGVNQNLLLNICYPNTTVDTFAKRPLIVLMHGGGFLVGSKNDLNLMCVEFSKRGFVAATIGYRLGWNSAGGGCNGDTISNEKAVYRGFQDAHAALRYLVANADTYKIDTAWIFCGGESAGGVNSLNIAFTDQNEMNLRFPFLQQELGEINNSGNNLQNIFSVKAIFNNWGSIVETDFINSNDAIPMIAFHGNQDQCLPIDYGTYNNCSNYVHLYGSKSIYQKLQLLGVCAELIEKVGGDHGVFDDTHAQDVFRVNKASCFFKRLFCENCSSVHQTDSIAPDCSTVNDINNENKEHIKIFPNPCKGKFQIVNLRRADSVKKIIVNNLLGEKSYSLIVEENQDAFEIDVSKFPVGVYFVSVFYGDIIYTEKIIIQ